ncbi:MAG: YlxR family protein [Candidatus Eremiobacteraeota bacterium]|nr:YlxR family protein [Candidatus Eremiobacteraeota bacterium]MBV8531724.1 YlxR family protein [Candidatus Eremiobacteraeota bacterium]
MAPVRTCVGCRRRFEQAELVRFVRSAAGWRADPPGARHRQLGRGAYLCSVECGNDARKNKRYPGLGAAAAECGLIESLCKK